MLERLPIRPRRADATDRAAIIKQLAARGTEPASLDISLFLKWSLIHTEPRIDTDGHG